ncbi:serine O-acetyltransferase [Verrucomicrobiaceae bacterium N1E253]|uniref:Serine acetyltransferase n=2 Tax=Oceaniferula marina TaxID=2748318 RepID=A0A851GMM6_9BACT|nr:serine O-acetyltransferase [Oceaniferula marina]
MQHESQLQASDKHANLCHTARTLEENRAELALIWDGVRQAASEISEEESHLHHLLEDVILSRESLTESLAARLARRLSREDMLRAELEPLLFGILDTNEQLVQSAAWDLQAIYERDPACQSALEPLLFYKGFLAITAYRVSHQLWLDGRKALALYFQSVVSEIFGVDIHPGATIGCGILLDHATSVVVGETAIIHDNVSILHEVTLGGTGNEVGNRHPIVCSGVLIGAGSKILGRVTIGECAKIGAGSVVLEDVPAHKTVAGVPAIIVGESCEENPAMDMNQRLSDE